MIAPCRPAETIALATDCAQKHEPLRLTSSTSSHSHSVTSRKGTRGNYPGIVDQDVDRAEPFLDS